MFCLPRNRIYLPQNYFSSYVYLKDMYKTLKGKIQFVSALNHQSFNTTPYEVKLTFV